VEPGGETGFRGVRFLHRRYTHRLISLLQRAREASIAFTCALRRWTRSATVGGIGCGTDVRTMLTVIWTGPTARVMSFFHWDQNVGIVVVHLEDACLGRGSVARQNRGSDSFSAHFASSAA
jgi:hypothetical protein